MFETHFQQIKVHLSAELPERFNGGKVKTTNRYETGIHIFNAITNFALFSKYRNICKYWDMQVLWASLETNLIT